jgi:hypothetical protein
MLNEFDSARSQDRFQSVENSFNQIADAIAKIKANLE